MIRALVALVALSLSTAVSPMSEAGAMADKTVPPTLDLSAIRYLICRDHGNYYTGSAFLIAPHTLATARHVAHMEKCVDLETGAVMKEFHDDPIHDFALMSSPSLPTDIPYVKYRCDGLKKGKTYLSYGITGYGQARPIFRMNSIVATGDIVKDDNWVEDFPHSRGMRIFKGAIAPGMSGGPVVDTDGYAVAVNNAGNSVTSLLYDLKDTILCK